MDRVRGGAQKDAALDGGGRPPVASGPALPP